MLCVEVSGCQARAGAREGLVAPPPYTPRMQAGPMELDDRVRVPAVTAALDLS
jgi:hypothetical protein